MEATHGIEITHGAAPTAKNICLNTVWYDDVLDHELPLKFEFIRLKRQLLHVLAPYVT